MNHKEKLLETYKHSSTVDDVKDIPKDIIEFIETTGSKITSQKGVYTVLTTLLTHKILFPKQDVRKHQTSMKGGFSGRTIDTKYITPTLKELGLPSMAESGWLTRSLEQPYPYTLDYEGKISNKKVKNAFLEILDFVEKQPNTALNLLRLLLHQAIQAKNRLKVEIIPLANPDSLSIQDIMLVLDAHFHENYRTSGGAKLPVLAFYAIYQSLIEELKRYNDYNLAKLGSHTASDRTSQSAGDIEILKKGQLFEAIEIKLDKEIDLQMTRIAIEKIHRFNPTRYYILSSKGIKEEDKPKIEKLVNTLKTEHGCELIVNGLLPTIKYYLRLLSSLGDFIECYSSLVENDSELKKIHKEKWNTLIEQRLSPPTS